MKSRVLLASCLAVPLGLLAMPTAVEFLPSKITLSQDVKVADGRVLHPGTYDVQIHFRGFGNSAELQFFQNRVFMGKSPAEARGFPAVAPAGGGSTAGFEKKESIATDKSAPKIVSPRDQASGNEWDWEKSSAAGKSSPGSAAQSFSWDVYGFKPGGQGKVVPVGPGSLKLQFDSSNSAAGFSAILPYVEKGRLK